MTAILLAAAVVLTLAAGAVIAGWVTARLSLVERGLLAVVGGMLAGSAISYGLALLAGLNDGTVLGGPAVVVAAGSVAAVSGISIVGPWRDSLADARSAWRRRPLAGWVMAAVAVTGAVIVAVIFSRALFSSDGGLESGYATVWADWSQHLTTASSFAVAHNLPPANPLFSATPLLYPFLADFQSATLLTLGASYGAALAVPSALLVLAGGALVVCLARRLGIGLGGGVAAALLVFLGGGIGFVGLFPDACVAHGFTTAQCSFGYIVTHPAQGFGIIGGTLRDLPTVVMAQPRAYDGLPSDGGMASIPGLQWYTPLLAWWLPQRTIVYGFAAAIAALVLVYAGLQSRRGGWPAFLVAGALIGLLPIVHIQTLIALVLMLLVIAAIHRRREWLGLAAVAAVIGLPRLVQVAIAAHGSAAAGDEYPWFEPGWLGAAPNHLDFSAVNAFIATGQALRQLVSPRWWGFWAANLGVAVPLCTVLVLAGAAALVPGRAGAWALRVIGVVPRPLLELFAGAMVVFAVCNVVVFQSWDWDNTKLLVYWYLVVGLVAGALLTAAWRHRWRGLLASALFVTMVLTGAVVMLRFGPWTPAANQVGGPFVIVDAQERALAETVAAETPPHSIFLTFGIPNDPVLTVAGRTSLMGYYGWLWSYGTLFGTRQSDIDTMYRGCAATTNCPVVDLLRRYGVSYVELDDRVSSPGAVTPDVGFTWWSSQGFPVVARTAHIVVYDVRGVT
ncbi:MAG TPA: hypothetical protein VF155_03885 [Candidatus Dormibacteraeota bacterium]